MKTKNYALCLIAFIPVFITACANTPLSTNIENNGNIKLVAQPAPSGAFPRAKNGDVLLGNPKYPAISYGAWRSKVRESGPLVPTVQQQKEDMRILAAMGIKVLRTYNTQAFIGLDGKSNTENLLEAIKQLSDEDENFEMYVMLGIWIDALNSFTDKPVVHNQENSKNALEMAAGIKLTQQYPSIVKVLAVGNEAMVHWAPYHVVPGIILKHVNALQTLKETGEIGKDVWITSSDNHASWGSEGAGGPYESDDLVALIKAVDYISLHTYPFHDSHYADEFWLVPHSEANLTNKQKIDAAMARAKALALKQTRDAQRYMLSLGVNKQIHIGETGWASFANVNYGDNNSRAADEYKQRVFADNMRAWSDEFGASLFLFQAFDEPWKGNATNPGDSEKHFGLIDIDGNAKYIAWDMVSTINNAGLKRGKVTTFTKSFNGDINALMETVKVPKAQAPKTQ